MPYDTGHALQHPESAAWALDALDPDDAAAFEEHLRSCQQCQEQVAEFASVARSLALAAPADIPPPDLLSTTLAAVRGAAEAERRTEPAPAPEPEPRPGRHPPAADLPADEPGASAPVIAFPGWRRSRGRLASAVAVAAVIIVAAILVVPRLAGGPATGNQATVVIPLHASTAAEVSGIGTASGRATARPAGQSWTYVLTVHGLKPLPGNDFYECWYAAPGSTQSHPVLASGGTFVVDSSGSATVTMTSGVDPRQFRTMEITHESPGNGALHGAILLIGQSTT